MTYKVYLDGGGEPLYPEKETGRGDGRKKALCECGLWAYPFAMVDMRPYDLGGDFACDGCITKWERNKTPINTGDDFLISHEWWLALSEHRSGPNPNARTVVKEYMNKEIAKLKKREDAYNSEPNHKNRAKLKARRLKLEARL